MKNLISFLIVVSTWGARAELTQILALEQNLEQRIFRQVQSVDPNVQVVVKVKMKQAKVSLPGVSIDYFGPTGVDEVRAEDIESIDIQIVSALSPFPDWLAKDVEQRYSIGAVKAALKVTQFEPETLRVIRERDPIAQTADRILSQARESWPQLLAALSVVVAVVMTGFAFLVAWMVRVWRTQIGRLLGGLENRSGGGMQDVTNAREESKAQAASIESAGAEIDLADESLVELLTDCYWTENDGYARWVWDHLSNEQRQRLLSAWEPMVHYVRYIRTQEPVARDDHNHPYYLNPLHLRHCDQNDLAEYVQKEKGVWLLLPPLRQAALELPLKSKVQLASAKPSGAKAQGPKSQSKPRELDFYVNWGQLSLEDEQLLMTDPSFVPSSLWPGLTTLVWLARMDLEARKGLLSRYSAAEIAQCWIGPEDVLARVREAIPDKKLKLVESYSATLKPQRSSAVFARLAREAAQSLAAGQDQAFDEKKAA